MKEEIIKFILQNNLRLFEKSQSSLNNNSIYKTRDAKSIHSKLINQACTFFNFQNTKQIFNFFKFTDNMNEIKKRQEFFKQQTTNNNFFKLLTKPKPIWKPKYDVTVATEDEKCLIELQKLNCPVIFINSESDVRELEKYDLIQAIECENFSFLIEKLPNAVFIENMEDVYLERFLTLLSAWKNNLEILKQQDLGSLNTSISNLSGLFFLISENAGKILSRENIDNTLEKINQNLFAEIKKITISGESLLSLISQGIPKELQEIMDNEIAKTHIPSYLLTHSIPLKVDEKEIETYLKLQSSNEFANSLSIIKKNAGKIKQIPEKLKILESNLLLYDFVSGLNKLTSGDFPEYSEELIIENSKNLFLENPQPISFNLNNKYKCSILTGANSGGKTTLLEHIIQIISLFQLGLPAQGKVKLPLFSEVYYFAKNKGSMSKGAFETLLSQLSTIKPGNKTLILADEIESVTEPGVAGSIITATCDYFIKKNCFLIIATHLGQEIQPKLPDFSRIDGIEAKGLDKNFELIVDHNPVLGRLAHSTPELIVERLANSKKHDYFIYLWEKLKKQSL